MKKSKILIIIISLWVALSFFRTIYNISKMPSEISIFKLSEVDKRKNAYGSTYNLSEFIKKNTPLNARIIFHTSNSDSKDFYLSRYLVYPRLLYLSTSNIQNSQMLNTGDYSYLVSVEKEFSQYSQIKKYNNTVYLYLLR